jgi:hypothetical protein
MKVKWAGHVAHTAETKNLYITIFSGNTKGRYDLGPLDLELGIIVKWELKQDGGLPIIRGAD